MKVLLIAPACDGEDVGESWLAFQWAKELSERFDLTVLTTYKAGHTPLSRQLAGARVVEWAEPRGVGRFERLNSLLQPGYIPFYSRARRWVKRQLRHGERFDVAHQVVPVAMRYPSPVTGLGIPLVIGPVGGSLESPSAFVAEEEATPWYQRLRALDRFRLRHDPLLRRTYESADVVVGIAPYVGEILDGLSLRRFETMSDVALDRVQPEIDRSGRAGPIRLVHVGRIVRTKGLRDILRAMARLGDLDIVLDVVGEGNDRENCEQLVRELGLDGRVHLHGAVPRREVDRFYELADVFVFPSYREPGGSVVLEAMAFGLPLIVCDRGGPTQNVTDACAVRLQVQSPQQLASDLASAIRRLAEDSTLRREMGAAAREHAASTHLWSTRFGRMAALYEEITARPPSNI